MKDEDMSPLNFSQLNNITFDSFKELSFVADKINIGKQKEERKENLIGEYDELEIKRSKERKKLRVKSIHNYPQYKQNVMDWLARRNNPPKRITEFNKWFSKVYDPKQRVYFDKRLICQLHKIYKKVKTRNTFTNIAFVGPGGTGKSTLAKQVFFTLNPKFSYKKGIAETTDRFVEKLEQADHFDCILLDEPDETLHSLSKKGKLLKSILGRIRQKNLFMGICATELTSIPSLIYNKLDSIFYMPEPPRFEFYINNPSKEYYPVQMIKKGYKDSGYSIFKKVKQSNLFIRGMFSKESPLSLEDEKEYLKEKEGDLNRTFKEYAKSKEGGHQNITDNIQVRNYFIKKMYKDGKGTQKEIGKLFNLRRDTINKILKK